MTDTVVNLPAPTPQKREIQNVIDPVPILDTARFEHMQRIASIMARSSMIPETLRTTGPKNNKVDLPFEQVLSNCFLVVNQAARWGMDPFAVISCCSVVHGRLAYEGKLVAAVLEAKLGVALRYVWDDQPGESLGIAVSGQLPDGRVETITGTVKDWKTNGDGSPWKPSTYRKMLAYRGAREWARLHAPAVMLGVYSNDELEELAEDARARRAAPVSLAQRLAASNHQTGDGFSQSHVLQEIGGDTQGEDAVTQPNNSANTGGGHEVTAMAEAPDQTSSATNSNSSQHNQPSPAVAETDTPASDPLAPNPADAGNQSESSEGSPAPDDGVQADAELDKPGVGLPAGWQKIYAEAMTRVSDKPKSLATRRNEALKHIGGEPSEDDKAEMRAMEDLVIRRNNGELTPDAFKAALREIVPDGGEA
ncbi:MAG: hypothetical protein WBF99_12560 [Xanthobacteraceae bacterium]